MMDSLRKNKKIREFEDLIFKLNHSKVILQLVVTGRSVHSQQLVAIDELEKLFKGKVGKLSTYVWH